MIRYSLKCTEGHAFESWFQSADAFDSLSGRRMLSCVVCGTHEVGKAVMAPPVAKSGGKEVVPAPPAPVAKPPAHPGEEAIKALKDHIEKHSTYVGGRFAQEARKMHLGDAPERMIHGEANPEEARALVEDGIKIAPLPFIPKPKAH